MQETRSPHGQSPNCSSRKGVAISAIVIHDTAGRTAEGALSWFANPASRVSAHVVIDRDGTVYRVVDDSARAWHAGVSQLAGVQNVNVFSLGVELVDEDQDALTYTAEQLHACARWCAEHCITYGIPLNRIVGHDHVCLPPGRKVDPGKDFPWPAFLQMVAGYIDTLSAPQQPPQT